MKHQNWELSFITGPDMLALKQMCESGWEPFAVVVIPIQAPGKILPAGAQALAEKFFFKRPKIDTPAPAVLEG